MPKYTRTHYEAFARMLHELKPGLSEGASVEFAQGMDSQWAKTVTHVCEFFENDNPSFRRTYFLNVAQGIGRASKEGKD